MAAITCSEGPNALSLRLKMIGLPDGASLSEREEFPKGVSEIDGSAAVKATLAPNWRRKFLRETGMSSSVRETLR